MSTTPLAPADQEKIMSHAVVNISSNESAAPSALERLHEIDRDAVKGYSPLATWSSLQSHAATHGLTVELAVIQKDYGMGMGPWERFEVTYADAAGVLPLSSIFAADGKVEMYVGEERLSGCFASNDHQTLAFYVRHGLDAAHAARAGNASAQSPLMANPPHSDAARLVAMNRDEYAAEQKRYAAIHGKFAGSLVGLPTLFAHEVRATLEHRSDLDATALCRLFVELHAVCSRDAESWLRVGLQYALESRPEAERTDPIRAIAADVTNNFNAAVPLLRGLSEATATGDVESPADSADEEIEPESLRP